MSSPRAQPVARNWLSDVRAPFATQSVHVQLIRLVEISHPLGSGGEQTRYVCHSRRKLSTAPSGRRNASSDLAFFRRLETDHGFQRSWSRTRLRNCRRLRRRRVPRIPLLRRPAWCRQQWQRLEYQHQGAYHSEFTVDSIAGDTASNSTRSSRTFVMMALRKEQRALRRGHIR